MKLHSLLLSNNRQSYNRMADVLEKSVKLHSPKTPLTIHKGTIDTAIRRMALQRDATILFNTLKSVHFAEIIQQSKEKEVVGMIDCDTMVLNPLESVQRKDFDLAITWRPKGAKLLFNSGVVFARISKRVKEFYKAWSDTALEMLQDKDFYMTWREVYGGVNQTSLGYLLERKEWKKIKVLKLDCTIWNCENNTWKNFDPKKTKIVHILGRLRPYILGDFKNPEKPEWEQIGKIWNSIEEQT